ncbi:MAG: SDR family NAD(P)-dependent oxidoreductase [Ktedonobacteraceae bacterium]|nr:SDR family NAD(P)-dependent oxidoreductase [Ktedonobacteraceae bacterium]
MSVFASDEDLQQAIATWIAKGKYVKLLDLWVKGLAFDWRQLYQGSQPRRVSLPTYPFARERYWLETTKKHESAEEKSSIPVAAGVEGTSFEERNEKSKKDSRRKGVITPAKETEPFELMTFEEILEPSILAASKGSPVKTLICFLTDVARQHEVLEAARSLEAGAEVIFVAQGDSYQKHSPQSYCLPTAESRSYVSLLEDIRRDYDAVDGLLYWWPLEDSGCIHEPDAIVSLLKAVAESTLQCPKLLLAGEYYANADGCYFESWIGFERSLGLVLPNTHVAVIYEQLETERAGKIDVNKWLARLWQELQSPKLESAIYRGAGRYVFRVRPTRLPTTSHGTTFREGGTYLITGGCGGLGLHLAEHLATKYRANLILSGRSERNAARDAAIRELEAKGAQVEYVQTDVCDVEGMRAGLRRAEERFGALHGVVHAAGVAGELSIMKNSMARFQSVLEPKIKGALMLEEALREKALDFLCYYSSSSAILGDFGGCDYAIANRFELAYARYCNDSTLGVTRNRKTFAVCWPHWNGGGMGPRGEEAESARLYLKTSGQRLLEVKEGVELFERLLGEEGSMRLVMAGQRSRVERFLGIGEAAAARACETEAEEKKSASSGRRGALKGFSISECILWDLKEQASEQLKLEREKLDGDENLAEFGFDSIGLAEFAKRLKQYYGVSITPSVFFSYPTLNQLGEYLGQEYAAEMEAFYREEAVEETAAKLEEAGETKAEDGVVASLAIVERPAIVERRAMVEEAIAIIGMSGRFPQARNVEQMWEILAEGRDVVEEIPAERFDWRQYYGDARRDKSKSNCKWSGFIPGVREFDPLFFEISPLEAEGMDPRQRLLLQESWKALEDAGYGRGQLEKQRIGMFVGVEQGEYQYLAGKQGGLTGNNDAILASRLAYFLNLKGPTMAINTACSSGLVAVHQACQSLKAGECDTAIAGSVNLLLTPYGYVGMSQAGMLSPEGKCYAFDRRANGMVPGEAVVAVVLKRLREAEADGDPIYGVIRGSGINYDGKTNGITAPSGASQASLLRDVYRRAGVSAREIEYIVTHGTGTQLGDPIEINALNEVFREATEEVGFCALTSTKTNFGHTLAASGIVSLVSLVQAMRHEQIPASLHCEQENDYIEWEKSAFYVNKSGRRWVSEGGKKRLGGVSAFGMSGTNAHVVVESYEVEGREKEGEPLPSYLLVLSAKSEAALAERVEELSKVLEAEEWESGRLRAMSYTLLCGRQHFEHRCALVARDREQAVEGCLRIGGVEKLPNLFRGRVGREFRGAKAIEQYGEELLRQGEGLRKERQAYQEALYALADLYCQGYELSWERLFGESKPRRLSLPTYPFARDSYWIENAGDTLHNDSGSLANGIQRNILKNNSYTVPQGLLQKVFQGAVSIDEAKELLCSGNGSGKVSELDIKVPIA